MPDHPPEYCPEKGWLSRQFENAKRDVAEWPEWMRKESGRMKTDMTTAEMRCVHATLCANCEHAEKVGALTTLVFAFQLRPILDLAEAELASREREEREAANGNVKCARCGYLGRRHFELDCFDHEFVPGSERFVVHPDGRSEWVPTDSPVTDGEAG